MGEYMGTVFPRQSDNMKFFAVLALAAVAFAEPEADANADPAVLYGAYGYGLPYASVYVATEPMEPTQAIPLATTERGLLMLRLRPMPRLTPLCSTEPMDMAILMEPTPTPMDMAKLMEPTPTPTTARGPLMLSPRPMPRLTLLCSTEPMDMASLTPVSTGAMVLTPMDTELMEPTPMATTARGPLMLSPRLTLLCSTPPPTLCLP